MEKDRKALSKILFIIPYYGKLPEYFKMWLLSIKYNPTVDFLLVTDIKIEEELPVNVKLLKWSWKELIENIQKPFDFKVNVKIPYKLCDFKPAYGMIFSEYIKEYDFWGNCDIDQVFGDIRKYITEDILEKNDVIGYLGHFTLYRNKKEINELLMMPGSLFEYREVYSNEEWYAFDEVTGIKQIVLKNGIVHYYNQDIVADIMTAHKQMKIGGKRNYKYQVFFWENGQVFRTYIENNEIFKEEFMYLHFQKKNPIPKSENVCEHKSFYILSDSFIEKKANIPSYEEIIDFSRWRGKTYEKLEKAKKSIQKIYKFMKISKVQKQIWIKQKMYRM